MSLPQRYLKLVTQLAASGALGAALLLGAAAPAAADQEPLARQPTNAQAAGVAERLAAIRDAVSTVAGETAPGQRLAWGNWWRNWRWAHPWGWGNGPWGNWRNGWPNWHNFWGNY